MAKNPTRGTDKRPAKLAARKSPRRSARPSADKVSPLSKWTFLDDEWNVKESTFESPSKQRSAAQIVVFGDAMKDGVITADVTLVKSLGERWKGQAASEANVIFRFGAPDQHYYAGVGAWGAKFHISKALPGPTWLRLNAVGSAETLTWNRPYKLRVECQGSKIVLLESDTKVLEAIDDDYVTGRWGLSTWKTRARFETREPNRSPANCFVVMPFAPALDGVYQLIQSVVESYDNVKCTRADQLTVSRPIMEDVRNEIARADLIIVDLTGRNSNVYYEAGMAAAWKKDWIVIAQSNDDLTFDVEQIRTILYANRMGGDPELETRLREAIESTLGVSRKTTRTRRPPKRSGVLSE